MKLTLEQIERLETALTSKAEQLQSLGYEDTEYDVFENIIEQLYEEE